MTEQFKILDARTHCRTRPGMYVGSVSLDETQQFLFGKWGTIQYVPALFKMINEVIDNSIDEYLRSDGKFANKISVNISNDTVTVTDNGRGIPQDQIETPEGDLISRPVAAWTRNNAGTSFGESRTTIGSHGLGAALVNYMSTSFIGNTWQNGSCIKVTCSDGSAKVDVKTTKKAGNGTSVTFTPDFEFFESKSFDDQDIVALVEDRLIGLQMAFPKIAFTFNGTRIRIRDIRKYAEMFAGDGATVVHEKSDNLSFFFTSSDDGFRSNSFVNGVNTRLGGTYVDYIVNSVADELVVMIKKKHKIEITKTVLKNGLTFVMFAKDFVNPKYDSQTKERLTNSVAEVRKHFDGESIKDFKAIARKIFAADDIIEPIIAAQLEKKKAEDRRNAIVSQKKLKKVKVAKHIAANKSQEGTLFLMEGLSALGFFLKVRDTNYAGAYPLRGVTMNTWDMKPADVLKNKELSELVAILGLDINDPNSVDTMNYQKVATLCDADHDGAGHIAPLLVAFFYKFWPRLLTENRIGVTRSPIMISTNGKDEKWFFSYDEAKEFKETVKGYGHRYIKGLGSLTEEEYGRVVNQPVIDVIEPDFPDLFEMMFGSDSHLRKKFMMQ